VRTGEGCTAGGSWCAGRACVHTPCCCDSQTTARGLPCHRGAYAVGYGARPLGALLFGHVGDSRSRRLGLLATIAIMTLTTVLIGCLPTYAMVGMAAPVLLFALRAIQGLAVGGEYGTAQVRRREH